MTTDPSPPTDASQGDDSSLQAQGAASTSQGDTSSTTPRSIEELERLNAELLRDNARYRKKAKEHESASQAAEQARLAEQGQFKELAAQHENRVKELEPKAQRFEEMSEKLRKQIKAATKEWPAEIKAFYPGDDADIMQIQDWYERSQPLLAKMQEQARSTLPGSRPNPPPANAAESRQRLIEANRQTFVRQRNYGL